jgi:glyoxylase I family protein
MTVGAQDAQENHRMKKDTTNRRAPIGEFRFEHIGLNVHEPVEMAEWYVKNLGMRIAREGPPPVNARFIADHDGHAMFEFYTNPPDSVPDYGSMDPLLLHLAFVVDDVDDVFTRLIAAGAKAIGQITVAPSGDKIAMLRDPWGLALQFIKRADPMLSRD